jgi:hypothetical protein
VTRDAIRIALAQIPRSDPLTIGRIARTLELGARLFAAEVTRERHPPGIEPLHDGEPSIATIGLPPSSEKIQFGASLRCKALRGSHCERTGKK